MREGSLEDKITKFGDKKPQTRNRNLVLIIIHYSIVSKRLCM
jgi:hypothetical protein